MHIQIELILSFSQMWIQYPQLSLIHPDNHTGFVCAEYTIPVTAVTGVSQPLQHLVRLGCNFSFHPLQGQV